MKKLQFALLATILYNRIFSALFSLVALALLICYAPLPAHLIAGLTIITFLFTAFSHNFIMDELGGMQHLTNSLVRRYGIQYDKIMKTSVMQGYKIYTTYTLSIGDTSLITRVCDRGGTYSTLVQLNRNVIKYHFLNQ